MTRDGSVPGPIEPGRRCFVLPCVFGPPPKPQRFTTPWKPRPFVVPVTFTVSPGAKIVTSILSPTLCDGISAFALPGSSSRTLRVVRGAVAGFEESHVAGRLRRRADTRLLRVADLRGVRAIALRRLLALLVLAT